LATFAEELADALATTPVYDPHAHVRPDRPAADTIADIVLYHHVWIELVSSGMPATAVTKAGLPHELADPDMEPVERVRAALPYLDNLRATTSGWLLRTLLRDIYGVPDGRLTAANLEQVAAVVAQRVQERAWADRLLGEICGVERVLTVDGSGVPYGARIGRGVESGAISLVSGKLSPQQALAALCEHLDSEPTTGAALGAAIHEMGRKLARSGSRFVGMWLYPFWRFGDPRESEVTQVLERARAGRSLSHEQHSAYTSLAVRRLLEGLEEGGLCTIQLIAGAEVLPPHRSIPHHGSELVGSIGRLAGAFERVHFNCSTATDLGIHDLAILAKHIPNVSVAGYWWHTLYPPLIRKSVELRLDAVPTNKVVGFFSDAYCAEWVYPKLKLVKRIVGEVLTERVVQGLLEAEVALSVVRAWFSDNGRRIYEP